MCFSPHISRSSSQPNGCCYYFVVIRLHYKALQTNLHRSVSSKGLLALCPLLLILVCFFASSQQALAQVSTRWRVYKAADGLDDSVCTTVTLSQRSNIWVSHFQNGSFTSFDGYTMQKVPAPGIGPFRIHEGPDGKIWTVSADGLQEFRDQKWIQYPIPEIRALGLSNSLAQLRQVSLAPLQNGHLLICLPTMLLQFNNNGLSQPTLYRSSTNSRLERFTDAIPANNGGAWIGGLKGIARLHKAGTEPIWEEFIPPADLGLANFQHPFENNHGGITLVAERIDDQKRVIVSFNAGQWTVYQLRERVKLGWQDSNGTIWAMTPNALFHLDKEKDEFVEEQEIAVAQFLDAAIDPRGLIWIATSEGLYCRVPLPWRTPLALRPVNGRIHAFAQDDQNRLWIASNVGLHCYSDETVKTFPYPDTLEKIFEPTDSLWFLRGKFFMNAEGRLLIFDLRTQTFSFFNRPSGAHVKVLGWIKEGALCVQLRQETSFKNQLQSFDGERFTYITDLPEKWNTAQINCFLATANSGWWIGGSAGVSVYQNEIWNLFLTGKELAPESGFSLIETSDGKIWCGTNERLWEYNGKRWMSIRGGFDRVNKILKGSGSTYWIASNNGLRGMNKDEWLLQSTPEGLANAAIITVFEDSKKQLWAGTAHGVSLYSPATDNDPPRVTVDRWDNEKNNLPRDTVTLEFKARDRWRITETDRLLYSYRLDEQDWTPWRANDGVSFSELASGKHVFQLRATDRSWNVTPEPAILDFNITLPWYQETRLVLIALSGCGVALFFAILAYNRHRKLVRSYAEIEKIVALRTHQLEKANRELLHSQKMTALGTLSAGIAHDFNNILSIIKGSAQIIETNLDDREKIQTRIGRIKTVVEQGSGIVKAMLGFSRSPEKRLSACDLNEIAEETIKLLGDRFQREVEIRFERSEALPLIPASREFIQQILLNFIFNAADALNEPGRITLRTGRRTELTDYIALQPKPAPEYLTISVEDSGSGIAPETMSRIFEPFFTTKAFSARRGTGLGLSMVYELAREMSGGLVVKSEVGKGSIFTLVLPLLPQSETKSE